MVALVLQVAGAVAVTVGAVLVAPAAGFVVGGVFCLAFGVAMSRAGV